MTDTKKVALVTGANGFVGREVVDEFLKSGWSVRAATRSLPDHPSAAKDHLVHIAVGDIARDPDWSEAVSECDTVVHLAAIAHQANEEPTSSGDLYRQVNVVATMQIARAAAKAGVRRFVFASSIGVLGSLTNRPFTENDPPNPDSEYAKSKLMAEQELESFSREAGLELVVLRPALVYGPSNPGSMARLLGLIATGAPLPLGGIKNHRSFVSVKHLAQIIRKASEDHSEESLGTFLVADGSDVSTTQLVTELAKGELLPNRWTAFGVN